MTTPVSDLDERHGDPRACATGWDETRRVLEPGDGRLRHEEDEDLPPILVFAVTPTEVLVFTRERPHPSPFLTHLVRLSVPVPR